MAVVGAISSFSSTHMHVDSFVYFWNLKSAFFNNPSLTYVRIHEKEKRSLKKLLAELKYQRAAWRLEVVVNSTSEFLGNKKKFQSESHF